MRSDLLLVARPGRLLISALVVMFCLVIQPEQARWLSSATADDVVPVKIAPGTYKATGATPNGKTYDGDVAIEPLGKVLAVLWRLASGEAYKGIGLESGSVFGVAYGTNKPFGLVIYQVKGGKLDGRWSLAVENGKAIGRETLEGPAGLNGDYQITRGENPNGSSYEGHVRISPNGKAYALQWFVPEAAEIGTGILIGQTLVVAYGRDPGFGVVAYTREGDHLHGLWAGTLGKELGTEDLTPKAP